MLLRPACLASADAYCAATPAELAAAVLWIGFAEPLADPAAPPLVEVPAEQVFYDTVDALQAIPGTFRSLKWLTAVGEAPGQFLRTVFLEGVLFAEHRLLLHRRPPSPHETNASYTLLRRGRMLLTSGDVATYLG